MTPLEASSLLNYRIDMAFKMAEFDRILSYGLEDGGARIQFEY